MRLTWGQAHEISIVRYLSRHGIFPVYSHKGGQEYHYHSPIRRGDSTPSFHVNVEKNKWHDKGASLGGDIIELVVHHQNLTRSQACHWLSDSGLYSGNYVPEYPGLHRQRYYSTKKRGSEDTACAQKPVNSNPDYAKLEGESRFIIEKIQSLQHPVLLEYLEYRKINAEIAMKYGLQEISYRLHGMGDSEYFALVWFNKSAGCEINRIGKQKNFKGCLGVKDITPINLKSGNKLAVFEGFLDFLAYLTHYGISEYSSSAVILNSLSLRHKIPAIVEELSPESVYGFLDNDDEGKSATQGLIEDIGGKIAFHDKASIYADFKDFNDMTISLNSRSLV